MPEVFDIITDECGSCATESACLSRGRCARYVEPPDFLRFRQSRAKAYVECARRTVLETDWTAGFVGASADLGSAFHAVVAEILRTLQEHEEPQMATQDCIEIMREVMAAGPWVIGPGDGTASSTGYDMLTQMVLSFADQVWDPTRILMIEKRLEHELCGPDLKMRLATGTPDVVIADPPRGLVIVDHKTNIAKPQTPREEPTEGEPIRGLQYMSDHADFQLRYYGMLALHRWPRAQYVIMRERNWRWMGPWREAVMTREDLEHAEPYLGDLLMKLDRAMTEGEGSELAAPRSGKHCTTRCPVARSCPIPAEQRGLGAIEDGIEATLEANRWVAIRALDKQMREALKAHHELTEEYIQTNDGKLGWHEKPNGGRSFEIR